MPYLEINEVLLVHCNIFNNNYQQNSKILYKSVPSKFFCQFLDISPKSFIFLRIFDPEFSHIEEWFIDKNLLEIEDKINITLVIN